MNQAASGRTATNTDSNGAAASRGLRVSTGIRAGVRDAASGLASGRRQHQVVVLAMELG